LGGLLSLRYGLAPLLYANGFMFMLSGLSEILLIKPARRDPGTIKADPAVKKSALTSLGELYKELQEAGRHGAPLSLYLAFQVSAAFMVVSLPTFLKVRLGLDAEYLGLCLASLLAGSIVSALFMSGPGSRWPISRQAALARTSLVIAAGAAFAASFLASPFIWPLLALLFLSGMAAGYLHIVTLHLVYRLGEPGSAARRQGAVEAAATGSIPLGYLAGGLLATALAAHIQWMFRLAALFLAVVAALDAYRPATRATK
jgi:hypothetical protein